MVYAGFWRRLAANLIDTLLIGVIVWPIMLSIYGWEYFTSSSFLAGPMDFLFSYVLPSIAVILFWMYKAATPGKMALSVRIVRAETGERATTGQYIGRYFAYILSTIPLCLGHLWVAFDPKKQGWHDKLAGTVVVRT